MLSVLTNINLHYVPVIQMFVISSFTEGHNISRKLKLIGLFLTQFSSDQDEILCGVEAGKTENSLLFFFLFFFKAMIFRSGEIDAALLIASKYGMCSDIQFRLCSNFVRC